MQNLRDKLLKAGAVDKKQARKARQEARQKRKKGREGATQAQQAEVAKKQAFEQRRAEEAQTAAQREADKEAARAAAQAVAEREVLLRRLTERHALPRHGGQDTPFHFVAEDKHIRRFHTRFSIAEELVSGALGIVAAPFDVERDYRVMRAAGLERLLELAPQRILFWNQPDAPRGPLGDEPTFGARGPDLDNS